MARNPGLRDAGVCCRAGWRCRRLVSGGPSRAPLEGFDAELYALYLLLQAQRKRIGTALLIELAKRLDQEGFRNMAVWVLEANSATRFYETLGAIRVARRKSKSQT
jgi:GNAT superfamily N-acetyltransferase